MFMRLPVVLGLAVLLGGVSTVAAQDAVTLRYLPGKEPILLRKTTEMKQVQTVMDKKLTNVIKQIEVDALTIAEGSKKGELEVKTETKQLQIKVNIGALGDYAFDSTKNDNDKGSTLGAALTPLYERMSGANLTYSLTPEGKVLVIKGFKELLGDVLKDNPLAAQFAGGGSDEVAKLGLMEIFPQFPKEAMNPGHRWETPFQMNMDKLGKATGKRVYTYEGPGKVSTRKTAKINVSTEMSFDLNLDMGGAKVTGMLSITESKGVIHFDPVRGVLVSLSNQYTVGGNMNVSANGMDIPITMEQVQSLKLEHLEKLPK